MDAAFIPAAYPAYTTAQLQAAIEAGRGTDAMVSEIARRAARDAGDVSVMTAAERLRFFRNA